MKGFPDRFTLAQKFAIAFFIILVFDSILVAIAYLIVCSPNECH